jgi:hypothetical protein
MAPRRVTKRTMGAIVAGGLAVVVIAALVFQPWRLFVDTEVREADPFVSAASAPTSATTPSTTTPSTTTAPSTAPSGGAAATTAPPPPPTTTPPPSEPTPSVRVGTFRSIAHQTSGNVRVGPTPDGRQVVYLEDLATDNGPDVRVFLSPHPPEGDDSIYDTDELELGPLKGNVGDQTYEVPADVDLSRYQSVVLWCERFSVGFGVAGLAAP